MAILYFQNHELTIYRTRRKSGTDRYGLSATYTAHDVDIQPTSIERVQMLGTRYGATYDAFVASTVDIKEGDQVVDEDGKRYSVRGVAVYAGAGLLDHQELTLVSQDGIE